MDTVNRIDRADIAEVMEFRMIIPSLTQPSTAKLTINAAGEAEMEPALTIPTEIAKEKLLLIIDDIRGLA
jgi:ACT domain-containing protein